VSLTIPGVGQTTPFTPPRPAQTRRMPRASGGPSAPSAAGGTWQIPGASTQTFGPGHDLRGTAILPGSSPRTTAAGGQADTAFGAVANYALPQWNTVGPYASRNTMNGIAPLSTTAVGAPTFSGAQSALSGAMRGATGFTNQAAAALDGVGGIGFNGAPTSATAQQAIGTVPTGNIFGDDTGQVRQLMLDRVSNLTAPDRQRLAEESLRLLEERSQGGFTQAQRQLGQQAAALGRIGSGMTTTGLSDLGLARERELSLARRELANETAAFQLSDQLDQLGATDSVFGSFAGADQNAEALRQGRADALIRAGGLQLGVAEGETRAQTANADVGLRRASQLGDLGRDAWGRGMDMAGMETGWENARTGVAERNEDRRLGVGRDNIALAQEQARFQEDGDRFGYTSGVTERNTGWQAGLDRGSFLTNRANALGNREGQLQGFDARNREEARGERTFQDSLAERAQQDRLSMAQFAQWLESQGLSNAQGLFGTGQTGNVSGAASGAANFYGQQAGAGFDAAGQLASTIPYWLRQGQAPTSGTVGSR
jgi:hypothetical protein